MTSFPVGGDKTEIRSRDGDDGVQPDVVTVERDQAKGGVEAGNKAHDRQHGVDYRHRLGVSPSTGVAAICRDTPDAEDDVDEAGTFWGEFEVTYDNGETTTYPNDDYITIVFESSL